jgi:thiosulfate/3-mercaptopyruvate sulfurtransferase
VGENTCGLLAEQGKENRMRSILGRIGKKSVASGPVLILLLALAGGCSSGRPLRFGPVVEPDELAQRLQGDQSASVIVLDVRDAASYAQGHVAGAVRVDPTTWKDESLATETGLDHETLWHRRIGALGVSGRQPVVTYDDGRMTDAARIWFVLQHFGVPDAGVLNGGYPVLAPLIAEGRIRISRDAPPPIPVEFKPPAARGPRVGLVGRGRVRQAVEHHEAQILDARTPAEYTGKDLRKNPRGGHIPTALNLPHKQLLDAHNRLKSPEALAAIFQHAGFRRGQPIITHCDGGGRASLAALAAARAGYGPVLNYYLSFGDWAADASCPLEGPGH